MKGLKATAGLTLIAVIAASGALVVLARDAKYFPPCSQDPATQDADGDASASSTLPAPPAELCAQLECVCDDRDASECTSVVCEKQAEECACTLVAKRLCFSKRCFVDNWHYQRCEGSVGWFAVLGAVAAVWFVSRRAA